MQPLLTLLGRASIAVLPSDVLRDAEARKSSVSPFNSATSPPVSIGAYALRIATYSGYGEGGIVRGIILVARFCRATGTQLTALNVHRLLLAGVVVAAKALEDVFYSNSYQAKVGGVPLDELNELETELLRGLHYSAIVRSKEMEGMHQLAAQYTADTISHTDPDACCTALKSVVDDVDPRLPSLMMERNKDAPI